MATLGRTTWQQTQMLRWMFGLINSQRYLTSNVSVLKCMLDFLLLHIYHMGFEVEVLDPERGCGGRMLDSTTIQGGCYRCSKWRKLEIELLP